MKQLFILTGLVCLSFMLLTACAPEPVQEAEPVTEEAPNTEADVAAILNLAKEEMAAAKSGDTERTLAILSTDYERLPPNQPALRGEQARQQMRDSQAVEFTYSNQEVRVDGDLAYHRYSYAVTVTPKDGGDPYSVNGHGIQILQRQEDGSWKIAKDIWTPDAPAAQN